MFRWVAPSDGVFEFDTRGSDYDTVLALRLGSCAGPEIACNDDAIGVQSLVEAPLAAGEEVFVVVDSYGDFGGHFELSIRETPPVVGSDSCELFDVGSALGPVADMPLPDTDFALSNGCGGAGRSAVFRWTPPAAGAYVISTRGSRFDTVIDVRTSCTSPPLDCNDDSDSVQAELVFEALTTTPIVIVVQAYSGTRFADELLALSIEPLR